MDLLDIRKKAKEAKAAKEAEAEGPSVPGPAPVEKIAVKKVKRRPEKAAIRAVAIVEATPEEAPARLSAPPSHAQAHRILSSSEPPAPQGGPGGEGNEETEISAVPALEVETESSGKLELLAFMLGDEEYALKMEEAREIIRWRKPTKVPRAPEYVIGIISLRGIILPVFDVKKRLGLGELKPSRYTRIIVVSEGGSLSGMVVDRITGVTAVPETGIESAPAVIGGNEAEYIEGVGRADDRLLILIRASRALSA